MKDPKRRRRLEIHWGPMPGEETNYKR